MVAVLLSSKEDSEGKDLVKRGDEVKNNDCAKIRWWLFILDLHQYCVSHAIQ